MPQMPQECVGRPIHEQRNLLVAMLDRERVKVIDLNNTIRKAREALDYERRWYWHHGYRGSKRAEVSVSVFMQKGSFSIHEYIEMCAKRDFPTCPEPDGHLGLGNLREILGGE